ncbi:MAG TPA: ATP-binding protein [Thermoplasmata archaeon]|nr:ATP-binding protein [Thermoplasmata archaeon]
MAPDRPAVPNNSNPPADPLRVLVIDPNEDHQLLTVTALAPRGYQVKAASASREGLRLLEGPRFDAILVDAKLRDIGALEMLAILAERCGDVPRILLVPVGGDEIALKGLEAGATAFVMKSPSYRVVLPAVVDRQVRDVRSRRHMTEALAESQRVLSTLMSNLPGMAYRCRNDPPRWTDEFVSDGAEALTGVPAEDFESGKITYSEMVHPDDLESVNRAIADAVAGKRPFQLLYRIRTAAKQEKWVWEQGRAVYGPQGDPVALEGFVTDITEKKQAQDQIERSERMFRAIFEDAADGIVRIDFEGRVLAINPTGAQFLAREPREIIGHLLGEFLPPDEVPRARRYLADLIEGRPVADPFEITAVVPNGTRRVLEAHGRVNRPNDGAPDVEVIARDVTEKRSLLRKIAESERLASLGRLALYVAHEINTPLTSISLLTSSIEKQESDPRILAKLERIHSERRRAAAIITGLLNFSRPQRIEGIPTDLRVLVQAAIEHVEPLRQPGVSLFAQFADRPVVSTVDPAHMESVVVNLLRNALEATDHGSVAVMLEDRPDSVAIRVTDTGTGIPREVLERIFEPFFTTKKFGHGTGLGLAWSKKIIEGHGGTIDVITRVGEGTTFIVTLPNVREAGPRPAAPPGELTPLVSASPQPS